MRTHLYGMLKICDELHARLLDNGRVDSRKRYRKVLLTRQRVRTWPCDQSARGTCPAQHACAPGADSTHQGPPCGACCGPRGCHVNILELPNFSSFFCVQPAVQLVPPCACDADPRAKSKNHTNHNQSSKAHRNGIKKPKTNRYPNLRGVRIEAV